MSDTTIVPAAAGCCFLRAYDSDGELVVESAPLIAWRFVIDEDGDHEKFAVTSGDDSSCESQVDQAVLMPDGRVYDFGDTGSMATARSGKGS